MSSSQLQLYKIVPQEKALMIASNLKTATSFKERAVGLLNRKNMDPSEGLWIKPCNNIHTFFMKFSIDCIFLTKDMKVKKVSRNINPFSLCGPVWSAHSVIEMSAGSADKFKIQIGDQLYVVS